MRRDHAVDGAIYAAFYHQGQCCEGGTRLLVQEKIYDDFIAKLKSKVERMVIGDTANKKTDVGPVISQEQFDSVMRYIEIAKKEGGEILTGGERFGDKGFFIKPTVIVNTNNSMKHVREEIFGPVVSVIKFSTDEEAVKNFQLTKKQLKFPMIRYSDWQGLFGQQMKKGH